MIHTSDALSVTMAQRYWREQLEQEDYYLRPARSGTRQASDAQAGLWFGRCASDLGLDGPVAEAHFRAVIRGHDPRTPREVLVTTKGRSGERRAGWDFAASASKSVSLVALVDVDPKDRTAVAQQAAILAAHDAAVRAAITEVERYAQAERHGGRELETTGRIVAALFRHDSSRDLDPQLHTHVLLANMTRRADGEWRAVEPRAMYGVQRLATAVYRSVLAQHLQALGYGLLVGRDGAVEIAGVTRQQVEAFSRRRAEVLEQARRWGKSTAQVGKAAARVTRNRKQRAVDPRQLHAHWEATAKAIKLDLRRIRKDARRRMAKSPDDRSGVVIEAVGLAIDHLSERLAVIPTVELETECLKRGVLGGVSLPEVRAELARREQRGDVRRSADGRHVATQIQIGNEQHILRLERAGRGSNSRSVTGTYAPSPGLTDEQQDAARMILTTHSLLVGLEGRAGTGKSYTLRYVREQALASGWSLRAMAPTTKATDRLRDDGLVEAETVAKFLADSSSGTRTDAPQLWIIDEAGMISSARMRTLLERAMKANAHVVLVGDRGQHRAIEAGSPFAHLVDKGMRTARLTHILRQRDIHLLNAVEHLAEGRVGLAVQVLDHTQHISTIEDSGRRHALAAAEYVASPPSTLIIAPTNAERRDINQRVRDLLKEAGRLPANGRTIQTLQARDMTRADRRDPSSYEVGDVITFARRSRALAVDRGERATILKVDLNEHRLVVRTEAGKTVTVNLRRFTSLDCARVVELEVAAGDKISFRENLRLPSGQTVRNGTLATVVEASRPEAVVLRLDDGKRVTLDLARQRHLDHGYAVTSYVSQGQTVDKVIMVIDTSLPSTVVNREQAYVSVSRARDDVHIYASGGAEDLARAWARDSKGNLRASDLALTPVVVRNWQRAAHVEAEELRQAQASGKAVPNSESVEARLFELDQRCRTDVDPEIHFSLCERVGACMDRVRNWRASPVVLKELAELRVQLYDLRHGAPSRSDLGPLPDLTDRDELRLHTLHKAQGPRSPLTAKGVAALSPEKKRDTLRQLEERASPGVVPGVAGLAPSDARLPRPPAALSRTI